MPPKPTNAASIVSHPLPTPSSITREQIIQLSASYEETVSLLKLRPGKRAPPKPPEPLEALDAFRWKELPDVLAARRAEAAAKGGAFLRKGELERLMSWKLHRGIFRPTLAALIKANGDDAVSDATLKGLKTLQDSLPSISASNRPNLACPVAPTVALDQLCALKGVGPATASLILSCAAPEHIPFLSDELYEWFFGKRPSKYDKKEWTVMWKAIWVLRVNLAQSTEANESISARDIERAGAILTWLKQGRLCMQAERDSKLGAQDQESKEREVQKMSRGRKRAREH